MIIPFILHHLTFLVSFARLPIPPACSIRTPRLIPRRACVPALRLTMSCLRFSSFLPSPSYSLHLHTHTNHHPRDRRKLTFYFVARSASTSLSSCASCSALPHSLSSLSLSPSLTPWSPSYAYSVHRLHSLPPPSLLVCPLPTCSTAGQYSLLPFPLPFVIPYLSHTLHASPPSFHSPPDSPSTSPSLILLAAVPASLFLSSPLSSSTGHHHSSLSVPPHLQLTLPATIHFLLPACPPSSSYPLSPALSAPSPFSSLHPTLTVRGHRLYNTRIWMASLQGAGGFNP
ncbi:hypothetical protein C8R44DRAFT_880531 [Mycena epipterygia]|nr:hypothetical protein C8R44DRAFT_880531 [Mycena epipterygia]